MKKDMNKEMWLEICIIPKAQSIKEMDTLDFIKMKTFVLWNKMKTQVTDWRKYLQITFLTKCIQNKIWKPSNFDTQEINNPATKCKMGKRYRYFP